MASLSNEENQKGIEKNNIWGTTSFLTINISITNLDGNLTIVEYMLINLKKL